MIYVAESISTYFFSLTGKDHLREGSLCQDYSAVTLLPNGWTVAAVADGVGSAPRADEGSRIAVTSALNFCSDQFPLSSDSESIRAMLLLAFHCALREVSEYAKRESADLEFFDTTLTISCFKEGRLIYAHCGDGGIFVIDRFGEAQEVTTPQKGVDGDSMIPLRFGKPHWIIAEHPDTIPMLLLATDGLRDKIASNDFRNCDTKLYVPLLLLLISISDFVASQDLENYVQNLKRSFLDSGSASAEWIYKRLGEVYAHNDITISEESFSKIKSNNELHRFISTVFDDVSIVVLNDPSIQINFDMPERYFEDPDWLQIRSETHRRLYPHLYSESAQEHRALVENVVRPDESLALSLETEYAEMLPSAEVSTTSDSTASADGVSGQENVLGSSNLSGENTGVTNVLDTQLSEIVPELAEGVLTQIDRASTVLRHLLKHSD